MKSALLIGCNYKNSEIELNGCLNDVLNIENLLIEKFNYNKNNIKTMTDNSSYKWKPNKQNILDNLLLLVNQINGKILNEVFICFSGHGSYIRDKNRDERDGYDECLIPLDYKSGVITDDELNKIFSKITNTKCNIIFISDSCHSGSILDLKFKYNIKKIPIEKQFLKYKWVRKNYRYQRVPLYKTMPEKYIMETNIENTKNNIKCNIISICSSKDSQTSLAVYDQNNKLWGSVLITSFIKLIKNRDHISFHTLLQEISKYNIENKYTQVPILSSNNKIDKNNIFYKENTSFIK
jgi:hypothetical protein